ncbi:MAG: BatA domain-containing protein [Blastocatellia bacterium]|nr:BatA domain-containing protein [Blastocatellia bacterium]
MPFAFLAPLALAALGLIAAPVVIHMLRRARSRRLDFPSLRFLRETPSLVRRLTPPNRRWLLALRIAVIALIALAAAHPVWTGGAVPPGSATVLLLDASASMRRTETRDAALVAAREVIGRLGDRDLACVAQFDRDVVWLGRDLAREDALAALASYAPGGAAGQPAAAVALADRHLASTPRSERRIVLISDFQRSNGPWTPGVEAESTASLETIRVENAFGNAFVADTQVDVDENGERLACALVRSGDAGREVARIAVPLVDGAAGDGILVGRSGETWTARVTAPDGFDLDDVRYGVVAVRAVRSSCATLAPAVRFSRLLPKSILARSSSGSCRVSTPPRSQGHRSPS